MEGGEDAVWDFNWCLALPLTAEADASATAGWDVTPGSWWA